MSDNKDQKNDKVKPSMGLPDMDSTVRLDFSDHQNIYSTSSANEISPDDFEKTIDGLLGIEDLINSENTSNDAEESPSPYATDDVNFDELDASINSLSENHSESTLNLGEPSDALDNLDDEDGFDSLKTLGDQDESDKMFNIDQTVVLDASDDEDDEDDEKEFLVSASNDTFADFPLIGENYANNSDSPTETNDLFDLSENEVDETPAPVIDLTEDMLQKPSQPSFSEPNEMDDSQLDDIDDVELTRSDIVAEDIVAETPELTTTETNVLADATAAIKEINEEEKANAEIPMAPIPSQESSSPPAPAQATSSSNILPTFMGILGMAVGGFGAWMAYDASNQVADMERQLQSIDAASQAGADPEMIDIQQRLTKIERRLTGTPTLEAAAPLGTPTSDMAVAPGTAAKPLQVITPKTKVKAATASTTVQKELAAVAATTNAPSKGGWVVNVSSHRKESLATKEMRRLQKIGLNAELHQTQIKNSTWYRVQVTGFATKDEAKAALRDIEQRSGIKGIWISVKK